MADSPPTITLEGTLEGALEATPLAARPPAAEPLAPGARIDRYRIAERLGAGGMGVVYIADDPELDRRVALKVVRPGADAAAQASLVREAQAMARLQHPNVVAVYDVGLVDGRVFVAMELVDGVTARDWLAAAPRSWRTIVATFAGAGRGLAAAHAAGLIHRDFKPDNVLIGADGIARVTDFGLAVPGDATATTYGGTPPYMAPEQHEGDTVGEATDQFAFAASLWEAVTGARPFDGTTLDELGDAKRSGRITDPRRGPRWLFALLRHALASRPDDRFPTLADLVSALDRGLGRRRRAVVGVAMLGAAIAAFAVGTVRASESPEVCVGGQSELAGVWNPSTRAQISSHLRGLGEYAASEASRIDDHLDAYAASWVAAHREACAANQRGELTPALYERQLRCLERGTSGFGTAAALLGTVEAARVGDAIAASHALMDPAQCRLQTLASEVTPPSSELAEAVRAIGNDVERVRVLATANDPKAQGGADDALAAARRVGYAPLVARAELARGLVPFAHRDLLEAAQWLTRAWHDAVAVHEDALAIEAFARAHYAIGTSARSAVPVELLRVDGVSWAEAVAIRVGDAAAFERALLYNNAGSVALARGDRDTARFWLDKARGLEITKHNVELAVVYGNSALVEDMPDQRHAWFERERQTLRGTLGGNHVRTIESEFREALLMEDPDRAAAAFGDVGARMKRFHPSYVAIIDRCFYERGWLAEARGDNADAAAAFAHGFDPDTKEARAAPAYRSLLAGDFDGATRNARDGAAVLQGEWFMRLVGTDLLVVEAKAQLALHHPERAIAVLGDAVKALEDIATVAKSPYHARRLARARAMLVELRR